MNKVKPELPRAMATKKTEPKPAHTAKSVGTRTTKAGQSPEPALTPAVAPPNMERVPSNVPTVYADQAMDVVYGIHTTKIVFGTENGVGGLRPVGIAVLPTATLLILAGNIINTLTRADIVEETRKRLTGVLDMMREMAPGPVVNMPRSTDKPDE
ncbi:MAG: hypothetical protein EPN64_10210 [Burkholderiaceae bacterium]|nr:MAG: hypothetical protein EPN64_10210 [Burkholderiaceae bacterium]